MVLPVNTWLKKRCLMKSINHERRDIMEFGENSKASLLLRSISSYSRYFLFMERFWSLSISLIFSESFWFVRCLRIKAGSSSSQKAFGSYSSWFMFLLVNVSLNRCIKNLAALVVVRGNFLLLLKQILAREAELFLVLVC